MPTKAYFLDQEKTESVVITWGFNWKNVRFSHSGNFVGVIANKVDLKKGQNFNLSDSIELSIKLKGEWNPELELLLNGKEIPGSPTDPDVQLRQTFKAAIGLGIFNVVIGLLSSILNTSFLTNFGIGIGSIVFGLIIIALSYGIKKRSRVALGSVIALFILDIISTFFFLTDTDANPTSGIILKVFIIMFLFKGFSAIKKLNEENGIQQIL